MNLVQMNEAYDKTRLKDNEYYVSDWRKHDHTKIKRIVVEMLESIKKIDNDFDYKLDIINNTSSYLDKFETYETTFKIEQKFGQHERNFEFQVPTLINDNYYILNNSLYVPLFFLEKAPIDKVYSDKAYKIYANINIDMNFTFDFKKNEVYFKGKLTKHISLDIFLKIIYKNQPERLQELIEKGYVTEKRLTKENLEAFVKFLGFNVKNFLEKFEPTEFINNHLILPYFKEIFQVYFNISTIEDIVWRIMRMKESDTVVDMANINNRRVVLIEYLIKPVFELYMRLLIGVIDKNNSNFLPTLNPKVVITSGFNGLMHRGNLYDISLPYALPLINKISQDITIIKNSRLPKSWIRNDESAFGIFCPVSVSAQHTASNIVFTTDTIIDYYGKINLK